MYCTNCGQPVTPGQPCACGYQPQYAPPPVQQGNNGKLYSALAYFGLFWLIGLLATPEKNNPKVRFHVGQGLIAYIANIVIVLVISVIYAIVMLVFMGGAFSSSGTGYGDYFNPDAFLSSFGIVTIAYLALACVIQALSFFWMISGIIHAVNGEEKPLFLIGRFAFYK
ncbi:MAG: hypothetical protein LBT21_01115 [Oscillospiraceae bacterium]|jgi:uncharacterized membrane protein|nr:hypothetical protein [Oscillospiraceae bacterium]